MQGNSFIINDDGVSNLPAVRVSEIHPLVAPPPDDVKVLHGKSRISDADRNNALDVLATARAEGMISDDEFEKRADYVGKCEIPDQLRYILADISIPDTRWRGIMNAAVARRRAVARRSFWRSPLMGPVFTFLAAGLSLTAFIATLDAIGANPPVSAVIVAVVFGTLFVTATLGGTFWLVDEYKKISARREEEYKRARKQGY